MTYAAEGMGSLTPSAAVFSSDLVKEHLAICYSISYLLILINNFRNFFTSCNVYITNK